MATKIVKTFEFPGSSDSYQVNAVKLEGKSSNDFATSTNNGVADSAAKVEHTLTIGTQTYDGSADVTLVPISETQINDLFKE